MTQTGGRYPGWRPGIELRDDWLGQMNFGHKRGELSRHF